MWRLVLTVSLLCWRCEGRVTCRDNNNGEVDWYILYKGPKVTAQSLTGLEYIYIDSTGVPQKYKSINHPNGALANTLRPLFTPVRSMPANFGFISYSDQPPGCNALPKQFGHSKGVLMMDKTASDSKGVWLLHSTPRFPFRRDQNHFWPDSGKNFAQTFICVTFPYSQFRNIGNHLKYIRAFPFEHDLPDGFHQELKDAANWKFSDPPNNFQTLTSSSSTAFRSFAKQKAELEPLDEDLYVTIAEAVGSDLYVQTWGCQPGRDSSSCVHNRRVYNVKTITNDVGNWQPKCDHSKWCVAKDNNWICIADVNRAPTQYERHGGALCIENNAIAKKFRDFVSQIEDCSDTSSNMDTSDCDTDTSMD